MLYLPKIVLTIAANKKVHYIFATNKSANIFISIFG